MQGTIVEIRVDLTVVVKIFVKPPVAGGYVAHLNFRVVGEEVDNRHIAGKSIIREPVASGKTTTNTPVKS
jgi:hypothetical protein